MDKLIKQLALFYIIALAGSETSFAVTNQLKLEPLMSSSQDSELIHITVASNGCTSKDDFKVDILESFPPQLAFYRTYEDYCEAYLPDGVTLTYTKAELGLASTTVKLRGVKPSQHRGYTITGKRDMCTPQDERLVRCTMEFTEQDQFALECRAKGFEALKCGCHKYLCSGKIENIAF